MYLTLNTYLLTYLLHDLTSVVPSSWGWTPSSYDGTPGYSIVSHVDSRINEFEVVLNIVDPSFLWSTRIFNIHHMGKDPLLTTTFIHTLDMSKPA